MVSYANVKSQEEDYEHADVVAWDEMHHAMDFDRPMVCTSMLCKASFFDLPFYQYWIKRMKGVPQYHRKSWEWAYISQALWENDFLQPGKKGIVFACGQEPLPELFASFGVEVLATDLDPEDERSKAWLDSNQNTGGGIEKLGLKGIVGKEEFYRLVHYRNVDMNNLPHDLTGFDFCWSSCAAEHLGSLQNGLNFIKNSLEVLVPGGMAVHTTEFNLSAEDGVELSGNCCAYGRKELCGLIEDLEKDGHTVFPMDWGAGDHPLDYFVDHPPYYRKKGVHLRLKLSNYACTSVGVIVRKRI